MALIVDLDTGLPRAPYTLEGDLDVLFDPSLLDAASSVCWKEIIDPMLFSDENFKKAADGSFARWLLSGTERRCYGFGCCSWYRGQGCCRFL